MVYCITNTQCICQVIQFGWTTKKALLRSAFLWKKQSRSVFSRFASLGPSTLSCCTAIFDHLIERFLRVPQKIVVSRATLLLRALLLLLVDRLRRLCPGLHLIFTLWFQVPIIRALRGPGRRSAYTSSINITISSLFLLIKM